MARAEEGSGLRIEVAYCAGPGAEDVSQLVLPEGATVADALKASGVLLRHPILGSAPVAGVWGRRQEADHPLRDRDRVEIYRPLTVDPKEARRLRYKRDSNGARAKALSGSRGQ